MNALEKTGEKFDLEIFLEARATCIRIVEESIQKLEEGMAKRI